MSQVSFSNHYNFTNRLNYSIEKDFDYFLEQLRAQASREWTLLITDFRKKLVPYLRKQTLSFPTKTLLTRDQFIEEVIEETLVKFFELFKKGNFSNYNDLEATVITVASYKVKEGFAKLRRDRRLYCMETDALNHLKEKTGLEEHDLAQEEIHKISIIKESMQQLKKEDKSLLVRFFNGEELQDIASDLAISAAACRKRKQRILDKLKFVVRRALIVLWFVGSLVG